MAICNARQIKPGMVLLKDVRAPNGRMLFKKGTKLTKGHIQALKSWGVNRIEVEGPLSNEEIFIDPELKKRYLEFFSKNVSKDSLMQEIMHISLSYIQNQYNHNLPDLQLNLDDTKIYSKIVPPLKTRISVTKLVDSQKKLCSLPGIYQKLMEVMSNPNSSSANIAEVVSKDPSLSAKLLRLVNSPYFGLVNKIDTVSRAIAILGLNQLMALTKGIIIVEHFKEIPSHLLDMKRFWKHSIAVGLMSSLLCKDKVGAIEEKFMLAGLLHDIGKLIILIGMPGVYFNIMMIAKEERLPIVEAEKRVLGFDHTDVGYVLAKRWYFPQNLQVMIKEHHNFCENNYVRDTGILQLGDILTHWILYGFSGNMYIPEINIQLINAIGLDTHGLADIFSIFFKQIKMIENIIL